MQENREASQGSMNTICDAMLQRPLRNEADAKRFLINALHQDPGTAHLKGPSNNVKNIGVCTESEDYIMKIQELQAYLDTVKKIVKPGCSEQVLKVALSSMSSLVNILNSMSSTSKIHASL